MLSASVASVAYKVVVVGACGGVGLVGIPEVFFFADVGDFVYQGAPAVVDG